MEKNEPGRQYAFYFEVDDRKSVSLAWPKGKYSVEMISVEDGKTKSLGVQKHKGGALKINVLEEPEFALRVKHL